MKDQHETIEKIAKVAHEINRQYCYAIGEWGDQYPWHSAPQWKKDLTYDRVNFLLQHPNAGPDALHNQWMEHKIKQGWAYGPVKDPYRKDHPCILPFEELPKEQQAKDYLFRSVVNQLKALV